jgi:selenocysteine-specific elongation factor
VLLGTTEVAAKVRLLDVAEAFPGAAAFAQLRLAGTIATQAAERFILRTASPPQTIGGGTVLDANPARHRRFDGAAIDRLAALASGDSLAIAARLLEQAGAQGIEGHVLRIQSGLVTERVADLTSALDAIAVETTAGESSRFVARNRYRELVEAVAAAVERHHADEPESAGIASSPLRARLNPMPDEAVFRAALRELVDAGRLARRGAQIALAGFDPIGSLDPRGRLLANRLEADFLASGLQAPKLDEMVGPQAERRRAFKVLLETARLVRLRTYDRETALVLHAQTLEGVRLELARGFPHPAQFAVKDVRDLLGSTRRHIVPIMEHFDATGVTVRVGDLRRLRQA